MNGARATATIGLTVATILIVSIANSSIFPLSTYGTPVVHYSFISSALVAVSLAPLVLYRRRILNGYESSRLYLSEVVGLEIGLVAFVILAFTGQLVMSDSFPHVYAGLGSLVLLIGAFDGFSYISLKQSYQRGHRIADSLIGTVTARNFRTTLPYFDAPGVIAIIILVANSDYVMATAVASVQVLVTILALVVLGVMK